MRRVHFLFFRAFSFAFLISSSHFFSSASLRFSSICLASFIFSIAACVVLAAWAAPAGFFRPNKCMMGGCSRVRTSTEKCGGYRNRILRFSVRRLPGSVRREARAREPPPGCDAARRGAEARAARRRMRRRQGGVHGRVRLTQSARSAGTRGQCRWAREPDQAAAAGRGKKRRAWPARTEAWGRARVRPCAGCVVVSERQRTRVCVCAFVSAHAHRLCVRLADARSALPRPLRCTVDEEARSNSIGIALGPCHHHTAMGA